MRIAFYAPLKPPDHPVPSGDRQIAQLFLAALRLAGHEPVLVSCFRSFEGYGDALDRPDWLYLESGSPTVFSAIAKRFLNFCQNFGSRIMFITRRPIG